MVIYIHITDYYIIDCGRTSFKFDMLILLFEQYLHVTLGLYLHRFSPERSLHKCMTPEFIFIGFSMTRWNRWMVRNLLWDELEFIVHQFKSLTQQRVERLFSSPDCWVVGWNTEAHNICHPQTRIFAFCTVVQAICVFHLLGHSLKHRHWFVHVYWDCQFRKILADRISDYIPYVYLFVCVLQSR